MTFRTLNFLAPMLAVPMLALAFIAGAAPANAAPVQRSAFDGSHAQVILVDHRDGRGRGGYDRQRRGHDRGYRGVYSRNHYRPHYRAYRAPRYVYAPPPAYYYPPAYYPPAYYPYDDYYYGSPRTGYFNFSSPNLGFSFGY
ncbi:MAG: hypothetical protein LCH56_16920 [Proteobacteria bacterium]|nr:hypothetical protein [Pseudomonadota bacterium]